MQDLPAKQVLLRFMEGGDMYTKLIWGIAVIYSMLLAVLLVVTKEEYKPRYYGKAKLAASLGFVSAALICGCVSGNRLLMLGMFPSLLLCVAGDVFLAKYQTGHVKRHMLLGIITFLLAHIGFLAVMYTLDPSAGLYVIVAPVAVLLIFVWCIRRFHLKLGKLRLPAMIYSVFVASMAVKAVALFCTMQGTFSLLISVGGVLFFASDFSIIFLYFYHYSNKGHRRYVQIFNLVTYYYAVLAFAFSMLFF